MTVVRPTPAADRTTATIPPSSTAIRAMATPILALRVFNVSHPLRLAATAPARVLTVPRPGPAAPAAPAAAHRGAARAAAPGVDNSRGPPTRRPGHKDGHPDCRRWRRAGSSAVVRPGRSVGTASAAAVSRAGQPEGLRVD